MAIKRTDLGFKDGVYVEREDGHFGYYINTYKDQAKTIWHNSNGPAQTMYYHNGNKEIEYYAIENLIHRDNDLPAIINYINGKIGSEKWLQHGKLYRENGPAEIGYDSNGTVISQTWYKDNGLHREDGPAVIEKLYKKTINKYYINGKRIYKEAYLKKYLPHEYEQYLQEKIYTIDFKKYKILDRIGNKIIMEEI